MLEGWQEGVVQAREDSCRLRLWEEGGGRDRIDCKAHRHCMSTLRLVVAGRRSSGAFSCGRYCGLGSWLVTS